MRAALLCVLLVLASCSDETERDAGPADTGPPPSCESAPTIAAGDPDGHPDPLNAGPGEARAGRLGTVPDDPSGLLRWAPGDFVLANDRVAIAIEDVGLSDEMNQNGGQPIGIASVRAGELVDPADYSEIIFTVGRATVAAESVTVLADGSDGGPAIIRAEGPLTTIGFLVFLESVIPGGISDVRLSLDYELAPGAEHVLVSMVIANAGTRDILVRQPFLFAFQQNRMPKYAPGIGFDVPVGSDLPYAAFIEDGATSFAFEPTDGSLEIFLQQSNLLGMLQPRFVATQCAATTVALGSLHIGGPGLDGLLAARARTLDEVRHQVRGTVQQSDGMPAVGARVHAANATGYITRATTDESGAFVLHTEEAAVTLTAVRQGDAPSDVRMVSAPDASVSLDLGPSATVEVTVTDADGAPIPALVQIGPIDGDPYVPPAAWGERPIIRGQSNVGYGIGEPLALRIPATPHRMFVSRGYEHEVQTFDLAPSDGETLTFTVPLARVLDTPGVMCGDFHIHTNRSFDAEDELDLKVRAAAAEDIEIPVRSEHEWVADFEPQIAAMGLSDHLYGVASLELTTFAYGHMGVFPLDPDPAGRNDGAVEWVDLDPPTALGAAHARTGRFGRAEVIINHPRGTGAFLGYFNAANFDPTTGLPGRPEWWFEDFTLLEVFNHSDFDHNLTETETVVDWFSLLSTGHRVFAVGSSDSHEIAGRPLGYPRTCIDVGVDTAPALRALGAGHIRDRMLAGASTIVGGVFVEALARGAVGPGGSVDDAAARESIDVTVRAAPWVTVDRLRVFVDGTLSETLDIDASTEDPLEPTVRFRAPVEVAVDGSAFVIIVADGDGTLAPVYPRRRPFGVTNPIFFTRP